MNEDIKLLREALAGKGLAPTPWSWVADGPSARTVIDGKCERIATRIYNPDAEFIAACSPDRIARLLVRVEEYEAALKYYADGWHYQIKNTETGERAERLQTDEHGDLVLEEKEDVEIENGELARAVLSKYSGQREGGGSE